MGQLVEEVRLWNTPAIGSYLLWRFTWGYCNSHPYGDAPVGILHFIAAAILTSNRLMNPISNQRADLQSYIRSFESAKDSDILVNLHNRVLNKRHYTLAAIDIAITEGLLVWHQETGKIYPIQIDKKPQRGSNLRGTLTKEGNKAEILGNWLAQHDIYTIVKYLNIVL